MHNIVVSIGGSVLLSEDTSFIEELSNLIKSLSKQHKIFIIVGGGKTARTYIKLGRELNFDEEVLDEIGIEITRVNARLLASSIEEANNEIPHSTDEAKDIDKPVVVMGGTIPGHSTDKVGAELAEKIKAERFIIATDVDGIYTKDPKKYSDAEQIREISVDQIIQKYGTRWDKAGKNVVIDGPALEIIKRAEIPTYIVNGKRLDQLKNAIVGKSFDGTTITK